jgi:uncharacterized protein (DUF1786 family)
MQMLAIDIGTGTQDILLLDTRLSPENGYKLVLPSPTMMVRARIHEATNRGEDLLLTGFTMGGGPCQWAVEDHIRRGYRVFATPEAARTFNDDLEWVERELGLTIVESEKSARTPGLARVELRDLDLDHLRETFQSYGVDFQPGALGVAVFDHGAAPPRVSDRTFRFDYIRARMAESRSLTAFSFLSEDIPDIMTRMRAVASSHAFDQPIVLMDTAPAAVLGSTLDPSAADQQRKIIVNVGNFHTLAFRLEGEEIEGLFEHHTGMLERGKLESLLTTLASGSLSCEAVFHDGGHGAWIPGDENWSFGSYRIVVTGPRRNMLFGSELEPCFAAPFGDMMLTGCFGLVQAIAHHVPSAATAISDLLSGAPTALAPWDI